MACRSRPRMGAPKPMKSPEFAMIHPFACLVVIIRHAVCRRTWCPRTSWRSYIWPRALRSPPSHATMPGALTAHTEPNPSTFRRVVAAGIPLPATMSYTSAGTTTAAQGPPCASRLPNGRQPRCEVVAATTAREQLMWVAADGGRLAHMTESSVPPRCISMYEVGYSLTCSPPCRWSP